MHVVESLQLTIANFAHYFFVGLPFRQQCQHYYAIVRAKGSAEEVYRENRRTRSSNKTASAPRLLCALRRTTLAAMYLLTAKEVLIHDNVHPSTTLQKV